MQSTIRIKVFLMLHILFLLYFFTIT